MGNLFRHFNSKILLFGEYSVIHGSELLSIPFPEFGGKLYLPNKKDSGEKTDKESNRNLEKFYFYLEDIHADRFLSLDTFRSDLDRGLFLHSDIPHGYGLGSSGLVVASVFEAYAKSNNLNSPMADLKNIFSQMEAFFHGESSGVDPLSIFLGEPLMISGEGIFHKADIPEFTDESGIGLLDTFRKSQTEPLVKIYREKTSTRYGLEKVKTELIPITNACINSYLSGNSERFFSAISELSSFQLEFFSEMIPAEFHKPWKKGLEGKEYFLKLCGSGGGGFIMVFFRSSSSLKLFDPDSLHIL